MSHGLFVFRAEGWNKTSQHEAFPSPLNRDSVRQELFSVVHWIFLRWKNILVILGDIFTLLKEIFSVEYDKSLLFSVLIVIIHQQYFVILFWYICDCSSLNLQKGTFMTNCPFLRVSRLSYPYKFSFVQFVLFVWSPGNSQNIQTKTWGTHQSSGNMQQRHQ